MIRGKPLGELGEAVFVGQASIGPRTMIRGKPVPRRGRIDGDHDASIGPRTMIRGKSPRGMESGQSQLASIGPRTMIRGKRRRGRRAAPCSPGFNRAPDDDPGKEGILDAVVASRYLPLQSGPGR